MKKIFNPRVFPTAKIFLLSFLLSIASIGCEQPDTTPKDAVTVQVPEQFQSAPFDVPRQLNVPSGFAMEVIARVEGARFLALAPNDIITILKTTIKPWQVNWTWLSITFSRHLAIK
jgi:hypothetical protein